MNEDGYIPTKIKEEFVKLEQFVLENMLRFSERTVAIRKAMLLDRIRSGYRPRSNDVIEAELSELSRNQVGKEMPAESSGHGTVQIFKNVMVDAGKAFRSEGLKRYENILSTRLNIYRCTIPEYNLGYNLAALSQNRETLQRLLELFDEQLQIEAQKIPLSDKCAIDARIYCSVFFTNVMFKNTLRDEVSFPASCLIEAIKTGCRQEIELCLQEFEMLPEALDDPACHNLLDAIKALLENGVFDEKALISDTRATRLLLTSPAAQEIFRNFMQGRVGGKPNEL